MRLQIKRQWILFFLGLTILTFGARLMLLAGIGTGGIDALVMGLFKLFGGSLGLWIDVVSIILVIIGASIRKRGFQWQPIITSILVGLLYDLWGIILFNRLVTPETEFWKGIVFLLGILIGPMGSAIYILSNLSTSCVDYLMLAIKERFHLSIGASRILLEGIFVISACIAKGPIGVGTILIMILFGTFLQGYYKLFKQLQERKKKYV